MREIKKLRRPLASLLAACMLMTLLPVSAQAGGTENGRDVIVAAFEPLDAAVAEQTVPVGTARENLNLPDTLRATVYATAPDTEPVVIDGVSWEADRSFEGAAGRYTFTASASGYACAEGVDWPTITVTVAEQTAPEPDEVDALCAAIDALPTVDELYKSAPGDADPSFPVWVTETRAKLAAVPALQTQLSALSGDAAALERITEARADKLAELNDFAAKLKETQTLDTVVSYIGNTSYDTLAAAFAAATSTDPQNPTVIELAKDLTFGTGGDITAGIAVPTGKAVKLTSRGSSAYTISRKVANDSLKDYYFKAYDGCTLILGNVVLDGKKLATNGYQYFVAVAGADLVLESGAVLKDNTSSAIRAGTGDYSNTVSAITMNGGEISGNTARSIALQPNFPSASGKTLRFTMNDGVIQNNTANDSGAGVWCTNSSLSNCTAEFILHNGSIIDNISTVASTDTVTGGGAVYCDSVFRMDGGTISNNTANRMGGGVYLSSGVSEASITGGTITNNTAAGLGDTKKGKGFNLYVNQTQDLLLSPMEDMNGIFLYNGASLKIMSALTHTITLEGAYKRNTQMIGLMVASGASDYTITAEDLAKFSYKGGAFGFALENNQIKLAEKPAPVWAARGKGTEASPYIIETYDQLAGFAANVSGTGDYVSEANTFEGQYIKLSDSFPATSGTATALTAAIGTSSSNSFKGHFDGNGKTVALNINSENDNQGLFGYVATGGVVENVTVTGTVTGQSYAGGIVGANAGTVQNCVNGATVSGVGRLGGVTGGNNGTVQNCVNKAAVSGTGDRVGGVSASSSGTVQSCVNEAAVSGKDKVGGVAGHSIGMVQNCINKAAVTGTGSSIGGVVGDNYKSVRFCYNTGAVTGGSKVGGVVGGNDKSISTVVTATVQNCLSLGLTVIATDSSKTTVGRVVGFKDDAPLSDNLARADMKVYQKSTEAVTPITGAADGIHGLDVAVDNTVPLTDVFSSWDSSVWTVPTGNLVPGCDLPTLVSNAQAPAPTLPREAPAVTSYGIWVGGTQVNSENSANVLGDGKVSYNAASNTLSLNSAAITGTHKGAGIYVEDSTDFTMALTGDNVVGNDADAALNCGVRCLNNQLLIKGAGKLTVYLKRAQDGGGVSGVSANKGLTLNGATLKIINKDTTLEPEASYVGLQADEGITLSGANLTLTNLMTGINAAGGDIAIDQRSTLTARTGDSAINGKNVLISDSKVDVESTLTDKNAIIALLHITVNGDADVKAVSDFPALYAAHAADFPDVPDYTKNCITISGGTVSAISNNDAAIYTPGTISISDDTTKVTATGYYAGLQGNGGIAISGGTVNAASTDDCGIFTPAALAISGDDTKVTATGYYAGLRSNAGVTISGGTVDAVSTNDVGIFCMGHIEITGGSIHAKGGPGFAAIAARTMKSGETQPPVTITLTGLGEENGCKPTASDWFTVTLSGGGTETRSWTAFVPENADALTVSNGAMTNAVNEVWLGTPTVTAVSVTPPAAIVQKGHTRQFNATVAGTYSPAQSVTWTIEGNYDTGTAISEAGLLTVAAGETATSITVKATSTVASGKSATVIVTVTDKAALTEAQMSLTMDGWTYGEAPNVPLGSVTVTDDNGDITYQYSADGGNIWADDLPVSGAGEAKAGTYQVRMSYEGDAYTGTKTASFTVAPKAVILGVGTLAASKVYDGDTIATLTGAPALTGALEHDAVTAGGGTGVYATADAGTGIAVTVTGVTLNGNDAGNYFTTGTVPGLTGTITPADGKTYSSYADALDALHKVHIVTNVTPMLGDVTLPAGWAFTGDKTARIAAGNDNGGKQAFPVRYTPADPNYAPVDLTGEDALFPVSTVELTASEGLGIQTVAAGQQLTLSGVTLQVTGAALPNEGDYAIANMKWSSSAEAVATVTGAVSGGSMTATVSAVAGGVTMVGVAYQSGGMLGYVLVKVTGGSGGTANQVSDITDIAETLDKLIDPERPTETDKAAVDAVAAEVTKLSGAAKENLTADDVKTLDELKKTVGENISDADKKLTITIEDEAEEPVPAPENIRVVGAAIACGVDSGNVVVTIKPVMPSGSDTKLELKMQLTVNNNEAELAAPMFFQMVVPEDIDLNNLKLYHVKDDGSKTELPFTKGEGRAISFKMLSFSSVQFVVLTGGSTGGGSTTYYTLTATAGGGGKIAPSGKVLVNRNSDKTFTVTPGDGYEIADVLVDGKSVGAVDSYTFEKVRANHTIAASFQAEGQRPVWNPFADVKEGAWYYDSVKDIYERGLMNGTGKTTFSPELATTRGMIVTILWRLEQEPESGAAMSFTDVTAGSYCFDAVRWAAEHEIVKGYTATAFGPVDAITRQELAAILYRYARYKGADVSAADDLAAFTDRPDGWAEDAVKWAVGAGVLSGKGSGVLDPKGRATRAEVAAMLHRFLSNTAN